MHTFPHSYTECYIRYHVFMLTQAQDMCLRRPLDAFFAPYVPSDASHTISSCQISSVTLGQVPARFAPLSVSRHRQLLGRVTPCYSGLRGSVVAREIVVQTGKIAAFCSLYDWVLLLLPAFLKIYAGFGCSVLIIYQEHTINSAKG